MDKKVIRKFDLHKRTNDLNVWIKPFVENAKKIMNVLQCFGFGSIDLSENDFASEYKIIQLGYPLIRIDIVTTLDGLNFDECYNKKNENTIDDIGINFINLEDLKKNKKIIGCPKDLDDLENLP